MTATKAYPSAPVSWGELLDKISILEIKRDRIADASARANVLRELSVLSRSAAGTWARSGELGRLTFLLKSVNRDLWEIEDAIRLEEAAGRFGRRFVSLARSVYRRNDERAALKRRINLLLGSTLVEEKSYAGMATLSRARSSSAARHDAV